MNETIRRHMFGDIRDSAATIQLEDKLVALTRFEFTQQVYLHCLYFSFYI